MSSFLEDDLDGMFDDFAVAAIWHKYATAGPPVTYTDVPVDAIFDTPHSVIKAGKDADSAKITATCKSADLTGINKATDRFEIASVNYYITDMQPDGTGVTVLVLSEDTP